ncbi:nitrate reductase [Pseudomassariella vexata]|uniref:Nitrate reductase n=1 Tax=Pseudomassariella vexata TaxID=1141098 RepID=A0A1Y2DXE6_9PEZI|nr:nitrate reductase [Pseudomassariella vexata]ORY63879.1 nitrate reductase [Pseudomassariella vexata]
MAAADSKEFTPKEVAAHREVNDAWMVIHGAVYDITKYVDDHPGGADILIETAGIDASEPFDNAGHSDDAFEIMAEYRIGTLKGAGKKPASKAVKVMPRSSSKSAITEQRRMASTAAGVLAVTLGSAGIFYATRLAVNDGHVTLPSLNASAAEWLKSTGSKRPGFGFLEGVLVASAFFGATGSVLANKALKLLHFTEGFAGYPPHKKMPKIVKPDPLLQRGWLDPLTFQHLPLTKKELIAPNTYRFIFELPTSNTVLGLPIGQHVSIKADVGGQSVSRSYTPVSNNADIGVLDLVIKCYPTGALTGGYLANLEVGDEVAFRGPKGAMRYRRGLCKQIGMLAGGTGITPMYQLIRAICEDDRDTTEVSLIYANRTEEDILLRQEIEAFARRYPKNLKLHYLLDQPPENWAYGSGFVTKDLMAERFPKPNGKEATIMICGPPGMVGAAKKALVELGFEKPGAMSKMGDQIFCF